MNRLPASTVLGLIAAPSLMAATITADFGGGAGNLTADQVPGTAGAGWTGPWTNGNLAASNITATSAETPEMAPGAGSHLRASVLAVNTDSGIGRSFNTASWPAGIDPTKPVTIRFSFRLESANSGFTGASEHVTLNGNSGLVSSSGTSTWLIRIPAGSSPKWHCYNGARDGGSYSSARMVDSGMPAVPGTTYDFTIEVNPSTRTYAVAITNGTTTANVTDLGFRTSSAILGDTIGVFARKDAAGDSLSFSMDKISLVGSDLPAPPRPTASFPHVFDMVHHNPGETRYESAYNDPVFTREAGFLGKVYYLFDSPHLAVNWDSYDPNILPTGSADRAWVEAKRADLQSRFNAAKAAGLEVYAMSDLVLLPKRLVSLYGLSTTFGNINNADTELWVRRNMRLIFEQFPQMDGIFVRIGETYLHDAPYHQGKIDNPWSTTTIIPLMQILRDEVCVKLGKKIFFRTWNSFDTNLSTFLAVSNAVEPHPNLIWSIKHVEGDFHRGNSYSKVMGQGRHPFIVEVQAAREYEGKGAFPNYIARGAIEGFEEHAANPSQSLRNLWLNSPLMRGVWTWSRGGGWRGPYIRNELWCDLNAWVMAQWARDPAKSEEEIFTRFALERLGLPEDQVPAFRRLCLLSAEAVWRWKRGTNNGLTSGWSRDQYYTFPNLPSTAEARAIVLASQDAAVARFEEIAAIAQTLTPADPEDRDFIVSSSLYGLRLLRIMRAVVRLEAAELDNDPIGIKAWMDLHDEAWTDYQALSRQYPDSVSTLYVRNAWQTWGGENPTTAEPRLRAAARDTFTTLSSSDTDGDGISDAGELGLFWDQPFDTDGNGIADYLEAGASPRAFDNWLQELFGRNFANPALTGTNQDPDGDGIPNLVEFALGGNPIARTQNLFSTSASTGRFGAELKPNALASDVVLLVEASTDLSQWTAVGRSSGGGAVTSLSPGWSVVAGSSPGSFRIEESVFPDKRFLRVRAERSAP